MRAAYLSFLACALAALAAPAMPTLPSLPAFTEGLMPSAAFPEGPFESAFPSFAMPTGAFPGEPGMPSLTAPFGGLPTGESSRPVRLRKRVTDTLDQTSSPRERRPPRRTAAAPTRTRPRRPQRLVTRPPRMRPAAALVSGSG